MLARERQGQAEIVAQEHTVRRDCQTSAIGVLGCLVLTCEVEGDTQAVVRLQIIRSVAEHC